MPKNVNVHVHNAYLWLHLSHEIPSVTRQIIIRQVQFLSWHSFFFKFSSLQVFFNIEFFVLSAMNFADAPTCL